jgi:hypothetical protein
MTHRAQSPNRSKSSSRWFDGGWIVGPVYDWLFFIGPPLAALWLGWSISETRFSDHPWIFADQQVTWGGLLIGMFIHAHLVIVFHRSHGNTKIFRQFPVRFAVVPVILYFSMLAWDVALVTVSVIATFWDVYHSGLQTFGFARIYNGRRGNTSQDGRRFDWWLNHLLYAGPIVAGATMLDHFEDFGEFEDVGVTLFENVPAWMDGNQSVLAWVLIFGGTVFLLAYLGWQILLARRGARISWQRVFLLVSTGFVSIYTWGFNSFGEAFFIMNLFHALQYFGLVWAMERKTMQRNLRLEGRRLGKPITWVFYVGTALAYGLWVQALDGHVSHWLALTLVVSIMHFWYDGFVWSVRKKQV